MKKKIIFFDADGTLWYPKSTKRSENPIWIYKDVKLKNKFKDHLTLTPKVRKTLQALKSTNVHCIILSTHPKAPSPKAFSLLIDKTTHFNITKYFSDIHATPPNPKAKGQYIIQILKKYNLPKSSALMIGDSYLYDYKSAKDSGIDCILIDNSYNHHPNFRKVRNKIKELKEILKFTN